MIGACYRSKRTSQQTLCRTWPPRNEQAFQPGVDRQEKKRAPGSFHSDNRRERILRASVSIDVF
jgi:hypothetical protein